MCARARAYFYGAQAGEYFNQHCATRSHTLAYLTRTHASHSSLLSLFLPHSLRLPATLSRAEIPRGYHGDAGRDGNGIRILHLRRPRQTATGRDALVDIRMKVEIVARRARLHYSKRKEWRGGAWRWKEDGNCVSNSREMKWREKRKTVERKDNEKTGRRSRATVGVVDGGGNYQRIHVSRVI